MKKNPLTAIVFFFVLLPAFASEGASQDAKVSINAKKTMLIDVLDEIEQQTDYLFIYEQGVNTEKEVSVSVKDASVPEVMSLLLDGTDIAYEIEGLHIILSETVRQTLDAVPQTDKKEVKVSGRIFDENKVPLAGATVWVKETAISYITDSEGNYTLNLTGLTAPVISVSFIGYETAEVVYDGKPVVNIQMKPSAIVLENAVTVAYGTQRKESVIGSISQVKPAELRAPTASISTALAGQVS